MCCDKNQLRDDTRSYWDDPEKTLEGYYIPNLLPRELKYAREQGAIKQADCDLLVLLVGYSTEPLLQAICAFQPKHQILLVLNKEYKSENGETPGEVFGEDVKELIDLLPQELLKRPLCNQNDSEAELPFCEDGIESAKTDDQPAAVFRLLQEKLKEHLEHDKKIIIDITGAKKSMVAGAFLYAAYSGIPISYVDFDIYDPKQGKPFGYSCRIGLLRDPYQAFRLREWERVRQLYESYQFRGAREILGWTDSEGKRHDGLIDWMEQEEGGKQYFTDDQICSAKQLAAVLEMYELWDNGDFKAANTILCRLPSKLPDDVVPLAICELSDWPNASKTTDASKAATELLEAHLKLKYGKTKPDESIFNQPIKLLAYARDELAKIERLIRYNEDYRSAYLRAAGLNEFLLKARLAMCWLKGALEAKPKNETWGLVTSFKNETEAFKSLTEDSNDWKIRKALKSNSPEEYPVTGGNVRRLATAPCLAPYWSGLALDFDTVTYSDKNQTPVFIKLRGEAIHTHLFIPQEVAKAALDLTKAGCEEFESNWFKTFHPDTINPLVEGPSWQRLCDLCDIDFLPPAPLKKEAT